ncbi:SPOSA6832_05103 [Sporobolomyces salmonicolor]|uniref:SPOSA6832_05103-mRNA-1:cds n=1 Tax=Sporidiobolus salmonicolor TaxID=5005 RepID=A0A0D6ETV7_SPOSA|nr:SPOSA6832_05103 [Sporobolomyces salmonicolor]
MARHQTATGPAPAQEKQKTTAELRREREVVLIKWCIAVTSVYVLAEIVIDYQFNALFLIADSFQCAFPLPRLPLSHFAQTLIVCRHRRSMLNDIVAFAVQLYADEVGALKREHGKDDTGFSYGFGRTQFVTNLINGNFYSPETKTIPPLVASMGFLGLVWNVFMFFQFMHSQLGSGEAHLLAHPSMYRRRLAKHNTQAGNLAVIVDGLLSVALRLKIGAVSGRLTSWNGIGYVDLLASLVVVCVILSWHRPMP